MRQSRHNQLLDLVINYLQQVKHYKHSCWLWHVLCFESKSAIFNGDSWPLILAGTEDGLVMSLNLRIIWTEFLQMLRFILRDQRQSRIYLHIYLFLKYFETRYDGYAYSWFNSSRAQLLCWSHFLALAILCVEAISSILLQKRWCK